MSVPQLMGFELFPSPHVGEIRYIWSFWGLFLLIPIKNGPISNGYFKKSVACVGIVGDWQGVMDHGASEFWGFKNFEGHYDVINGGQTKNSFFST